MADIFRPDLANAALVFVPLALVTSALDAGILQRWRKRIEDFEKAKNPFWWRLVTPFSYLWGVLMWGASFIAIVGALSELYYRTNAADLLIFPCTLAVAFGLSFAMLSTILRVLHKPLFVAPAPAVAPVANQAPRTDDKGSKPEQS